jgi:hypothetical protein
VLENRLVGIGDASASTDPANTGVGGSVLENRLVGISDRSASTDPADTGVFNPRA